MYVLISFYIPVIKIQVSERVIIKRFKRKKVLSGQSFAEIIPSGTERRENENDQWNAIISSSLYLNL